MSTPNPLEQRYADTLDYLFTRLQSFHNAGAVAYKPGLEKAYALSELFGNPHTKFKSIHVGGTNGKGSTAHTLAAVLQSAGYKVGLYTSPHLIDFRERIRVNGKMIDREQVVDFVDRYRASGFAGDPSFFELTTIMAFEHFAKSNVDIAVIEVGLGGRLDTTNIINPEACVITNISLDHTSLLGNTTEAIAAEKAGIIKSGIPAIIGEAQGGVRSVFAEKAAEVGAPIYFAEDEKLFSKPLFEDDCIVYRDTPWGDISGELTGDCQPRNTATIMTALAVIADRGWHITSNAVREGFAHVNELTGLAGRWMTLQLKPLVVCDTGHNPGCWSYLGPRLASEKRTLRMVVGFVNDKDVNTIMEYMPRNGIYYFVSPSVARAANARDIAEIASAHGISGTAFDTVAEGYSRALADSSEDDMIFVGGSTFVVADLMASRQA